MNNQTTLWRLSARGANKRYCKPTLFLLLLFFPFAAWAQLSINYTSAYNIDVCAGGTVSVTLTNATSTRYVLPCTLTVNLGVGNIAVTTTNPATAKITRTNGTIKTLGTPTISNPSSNVYSIAIGSLSDTIPAQSGDNPGKLTVTFKIQPKCGLLQGQVISSSSFTMSPAPLYTFSGSGSFFDSASLPTTINFPYLQISVPSSAPTPCTTAINAANMGTFGLLYTTPCQTIQPIPADEFVYRPVTITNTGSSNFNVSSASQQSIVIKDARNLPGLFRSAVGIVDCYGNPLPTGTGGASMIDSGGNSSVNIITLGYLAIQALLPSGRTTISDTNGSTSQSITFYEKFRANRTGSAKACTENILSNLTCTWSCIGSNTGANSGSPSFCLATNCNGYISFPNYYPNLVANFKKVGQNYCYGKNASGNTNKTTYEMLLTNSLPPGGDTTDVIVKAQNINLSFLFKPGTANGWTDYDFSNVLDTATHHVVTSASCCQLVVNRGGTGWVSLADSNIDWANTNLSGVTVGANNPILPAANKSFKIAFKATGTGPFELNPGDSLKMDWTAITYDPGANSCQFNTMDEWQYKLSYNGRCDSIATLSSVLDVFPATTLNSGQSSGTASMPLQMIGNSGNTYPSSWQVFYHLPTTIIPYPAATKLWAYDHSTLSYVIRIELGADLDLYGPYSTPTATLLNSNILFQTTVGTTTYTVTPDCLRYISNGGAPSYIAHDVIEARFDARSANVGDSFLNNNVVIKMNLQPHCGLSPMDGGTDPVSISAYEVASNACIGTCADTAVYNEVPLFCDYNHFITVQCPGCQIAGLYWSSNYLNRVTFGYKDNKKTGGGGTWITGSDGLIDTGSASQPIIMTPWKTGSDTTASPRLSMFPDTIADGTKLMYNDVFRFRAISTMLADTGGNNLPRLSAFLDAGNGGFPYIFGRVQFTDVSGATNPMNYISAYDDRGNNRMIELRYYNTAISKWSPPIHIPLSSSGANPTFYKQTLTREFCYKIAWDSFYSAAANTPGIGAGGFPLPSNFGDNFTVLADFSFKVSKNIHAGNAPIISVLSRLYAGLADENFTAPSTWLVDLSSDSRYEAGPADSVRAHLANICDYLTSYPASHGGSYYVADNSGGLYQYDNILMDSIPNLRDSIPSCYYVRWWCVPGSATISVMGFDWKYNSFTNIGIAFPSTNQGFNSANLYFAPATMTSRKLLLGSAISPPADVFQNEYRNWVKYSRLQIFGLPHGCSLVSKAVPWFGGSFQGIFGDYGFPATYSLGSPLAGLPVNEAGDSIVYNYANPALNFNTDAATYPTNSRPQSDDAFSSLDYYNVKLPCLKTLTGTKINILLRETDDFSSYNICGKIAKAPFTTTPDLVYDTTSMPDNVPDSSINFTTANPQPSGYSAGSTNPGDRYKETYMQLTVPNCSLALHNGSPASAKGNCGTITWSENIDATSDIANFMVNPWIGFDSVGGAGQFTITQIIFRTDTLRYDTSLGVWLMMSASGIPLNLNDASNHIQNAYASTVTNTRGTFTRDTTSNVVTITASYCPNNITVKPKMFAGAMCDPVGTRALGSGLHPVTAPIIYNSYSCYNITPVCLPFTTGEAFLSVTDSARYVTSADVCSDMNFTYIIQNTQHNLLDSLVATITMPAGYTIPAGATGTVTYNNTTATNVTINGGPATYTISISRDVNSPLYGLVPSGGLPGALDSPAIRTWVKVTFPVRPVCSTAIISNTDNIQVTITGKNGCAATSACPQGNIDTWGPQLYNPLIGTGPGVYNTGINTNIQSSNIAHISSNPGITQCLDEYSFVVDFNNTFMQTIGAYNYLHFILPAGYAPDSAVYNGSNYPSSSFTQLTATPRNEWRFNTALTGSATYMPSCMITVSQPAPVSLCPVTFYTQVYEESACPICTLSVAIGVPDTTIDTPLISVVAPTFVCSYPIPISSSDVCTGYNYTWSSSASLFTDFACTVPYTTGSNATTVYATAAATYSLTVSDGTCSVSGTATSSTNNIPASCFSNKWFDLLSSNFPGTPGAGGGPLDIQSIDADADGDVYVAGSYHDIYNLYHVADTLALLEAAYTTDYSDYFLIKYSCSGQVLWSKFVAKNFSTNCCLRNLDGYNFVKVDKCTGDAYWVYGMNNAEEYQRYNSAGTALFTIPQPLVNEGVTDATFDDGGVYYADVVDNGTNEELHINYLDRLYFQCIAGGGTSCMTSYSRWASAPLVSAGNASGQFCSAKLKLFNSSGMPYLCAATTGYINIYDMTGANVYSLNISGSGTWGRYCRMDIDSAGSHLVLYDGSRANVYTISSSPTWSVSYSDSLTITQATAYPELKDVKCTNAGILVASYDRITMYDYTTGNPVTTVTFKPYTGGAPVTGHTYDRALCLYGDHQVYVGGPASADTVFYDTIGVYNTASAFSTAFLERFDITTGRAAKSSVNNADAGTQQVPTARDNNLALMPNPSDAQVQIRYELSGPLQGGIIRIYDIVGREIMALALSDTRGSKVIDLSPYAPGTYSVVLENNRHKVLTKLLVKN